MTAPQEVALRLDGVLVRRGGRTVVQRTSLEVAPGTATALVGPSGSGKTTLLAVIAGLEQPDEGTVTMPLPPTRIGLVLQTYALVTLLTAAENVELALQSTGVGRQEIRERAEAELARFGLSEVADRQTEQLSGGQQQRLALARAFVTRPRMLVADEFTSELDPVSRTRVVTEVLGLRDAGTAVVLATHDEALAALCDHVVRLGDEGPVGGGAESERARHSAIEEQHRRIAAQRLLVERETTRLVALENGLMRLQQGAPPRR